MCELESGFVNVMSGHIHWSNPLHTFGCVCVSERVDSPSKIHEWMWLVNEWVKSHTRMSHVTHTNESWMNHVAHVNVNELCHTCVAFACVCVRERACIHVCHDPFHICGMTHPNMRDMSTLYLWHDSFIRVTWPIHTCDITYSNVWHDSFTTHDMTPSYVWHDSLICAAWPICMCDMTHSYV